MPVCKYIQNKRKYIVASILCAALLLVLVSGCAGMDPAGLEPSVSLPPDTGSANSGFSIDRRVEDLLAGMTLDEKIYQMMFVTPESLTGVGRVIQAGSATQSALQSRPVGGIIYFSDNIQSSAQLKTMIANTRHYSKIPLFMGIDEEGGRVARLGAAIPAFPKFPPMAEIGAAGDSGQAYEIGRQLAAALGEFGLNVDFAPVADLLLNPANTEIGDRSFGSDTETVAGMVAREVSGLQEGGISAVLKHFPGHGSIREDTHKSYAESLRTLEEMREAEFVVFRAGIDAGADFVLLSHLSAVNVDPTGTPSSLSKTIVTDVLKGELGFEKLVITDSLSMGAVADAYKGGAICVAAIRAGVDMLLMPEDMDDAYQAVKSAVDTGEISEERLNRSVERILRIKADRGIL